MARQRPRATQPALLAMLEAQGHIDENRISRKPRRRNCRKCGRPTIAAITELGITTHLDPNRLTAEGEFLASLAGQPTFEIYGPGQGVEVLFRFSDRRARAPDDTQRIHAPHVCAFVIPAALTLPPLAAPSRPGPSELPPY